MAAIKVTQQDFLEDRQGRTFADVLNDSAKEFGAVLTFFSTADRQRRMEEAEIHHDRPPLAGVVRELESLPDLDAFFGSDHVQRSKRLRQAIGVLVRIIMQRRGWRTTGKKGSLGVRATEAGQTPAHNIGGLAHWFLRAERYELEAGMPFRSVRKLSRRTEPALPKE